jgi:hypothetical protein
MEKIIIYNNLNEIASVIEGVTSVTPYLDYVEYRLESGGTGRLEGFENAYFIADSGLDASLIPFEDVIDFTKQLKIAELSKECNSAILNGFTHNGDEFGFTMEDQANLTQQMTLLLLDTTIASVDWKTNNNGIKTFTREEFIAICRASESHKRGNIGRFWTLKQTVLNTSYTSVVDLKSVHF